MFLNCHSYHSLRYGTIPLSELVIQAAELQVQSLALTDINTITGIYDFVKECKKAGIKPLVGIEFRRNNELLYIGLAQNKAGIGEMNRFLTHHNLEDIPLPQTAEKWHSTIVIYPLENAPEQLAQNEYLGIRPEQISMLYSSKWNSQIDKMLILQPVTFQTRNSICIKFFGRLN